MMTAKPYLCVLEFALYGDLECILKSCKAKDRKLNEFENQCVCGRAFVILSHTT
jgi:hypothetical protein